LRRAVLFATLVLGVVVFAGTLAAPALATPSQTSPCNLCHSGTAVAVTATLASNNGVSAVYNVSAPTATAWAVFNGSTRLAGATATTGQFTVPVGSTYTVYAVKGPSTNTGIGSTSVSPAAPPADTTAPTTTSNAVASYVGTATIHLTATDNAGGSGVAHTYYKLDGGAQTEAVNVTVTAVGSHTLEFWSVDVALNAETPHKTATFAVTAPQPPADTTAPTTTSNAVASYVGTATIHLTATDNTGGSGVAHTYYKLDGGAQTEAVNVTVTGVGSHTLEFWSVDVALNAETPHKTATFAVTAPQPPADTTPTTITIQRSGTARFLRPFVLSGELSPAILGDLVTVEVRRPGSGRWSYSSTRAVFQSEEQDVAGPWWYRYLPRARGTYSFRVRFAGDETRAASVSRTISVTVR
jgi:hypothetical protein